MEVMRVLGPFSRAPSTPFVFSWLARYSSRITRSRIAALFSIVFLFSLYASRIVRYTVYWSVSLTRGDRLEWTAIRDNPLQDLRDNGTFECMRGSSCPSFYREKRVQNWEEALLRFETFFWWGKATGVFVHKFGCTVPVCISCWECVRGLIQVILRGSGEILARDCRCCFFTWKCLILRITGVGLTRTCFSYCVYSRTTLKQCCVRISVWNLQIWSFNSVWWLYDYVAM